MADESDPIERFARLLLFVPGLVLLLLGSALLALVGVIGAYAAVAAVPLIPGVFLIVCAAFYRRIKRVELSKGRFVIELAQTTAVLARSAAYLLRGFHTTL